MGSIPGILRIIRDNLFRKGRGPFRERLRKPNNQNSSGFALHPDDLVSRDDATARISEIAATAARQLRMRGEPVPLHTLSAIHFGLKRPDRAQGLRGTMLKALQPMCYAVALLLLAVGLIRLTEHSQKIEYDRFGQQLLTLEEQTKAIQQQIEKSTTDSAGAEKGLQTKTKFRQSLQNKSVPEHTAIALDQPSYWMSSSGQVMILSTKQTKWRANRQWTLLALAKPGQNPCMFIPTGHTDFPLDLGLGVRKFSRSWPQSSVDLTGEKTVWRQRDRSRIPTICDSQQGIFTRSACYRGLWSTQTESHSESAHKVAR